jgi:hypothetical protein
MLLLKTSLDLAQLMDMHSPVMIVPGSQPQTTEHGNVECTVNPSEIVIENCRPQIFEELGLAIRLL